MCMGSEPTTLEGQTLRRLNQSVPTTPYPQTKATPARSARACILSEASPVMAPRCMIVDSKTLLELTKRSIPVRW